MSNKMHRPKSSPLKQNPAGENNRAPMPLSQGGKHNQNMGGKSNGGKITNPMQIPNTQGYVGKRVSTK